MFGARPRAARAALRGIAPALCPLSPGLACFGPAGNAVKHF